MKIETISYLKKNAVSLDREDPILINQNSVPAYVIESCEAQQERQNAIALLKLLILSEHDKADNNVFSKEQLQADL
ncbi:type II toxin-antitoxin system Phd/YefM family antitoxin [uncultured Pluralibacter sp.]|uniref:type II toxin-antitoxin system Phd/YefM family antitoxin n=1 Tax=uncultured Pluralibacter sp. TaxID=1490864 RepID=UPI00262BEBDC|nr:type II toxin-antitoxin system Phd/YefM family antitoxin [uncultured Pluralibacter sp.]